MLKAKLLGATAAAESLAIEDVFSTYLYTGNGSTQTITNGIDLAGEGGLVWTKRRSTLLSHQLFDTLRGANVQLSTDVTNGNTTVTNRLNSFNVDGFTLGGGASGPNVNAETYASWTFRKAPRFFDVVTYTGTGANRTIAHDLGVVPGCIIVKRTDTTGDWQVYHRSNTAAPETDYLVLNSTAFTADSNTRWNDTLPTSTVFSLGTDANVNASGGTYVAYLFAHDPLGPSGDGSDGLIACGSYTGNGSTTGPVINLGWEPQWLLVKRFDNLGDWNLIDNMRGFVVGGADAELNPNGSTAEGATLTFISPTATGFQLNTTDAGYNASANEYIYIAIRRGPMREPTVGTQVFDVVQQAGGGFVNTGNVVDMLMETYGLNSSNYMAAIPRLTGRYMETASTAAEAGVSYHKFDYNNGVEDDYVGSGNTALYYAFRRAPGFFDVVAYTGDGTLNPIGHNLTVNPELIIFKRRGSVQDWWVIHYATDKSLRLNTTAAGTTADASIYGPVTPTTFVPYLNTAGLTHISYHFASLPGISKVGSYTGNGSSQTINCGFTTGARFILIKRTDSTGDWYVWDTARGIVSGNDPHLSLNTTAAEVTTDDTIDPANSGFIVNQVAATNVNVNAATYIYLAIA